MKEVYVTGHNGDRHVEKTVVVDNARGLVDEIRAAAAEGLGVRSYTINNRSGEVVSPIGLRDMEDEFEGICAVEIVPYNKAGE